VGGGGGSTPPPLPPQEHPPPRSPRSCTTSLRGTPLQNLHDARVQCGPQLKKRDGSPDFESDENSDFESVHEEQGVAPGAQPGTYATAPTYASRSGPVHNRPSVSSMISRLWTVVLSLNPKL